jgi:hypothetical protein
MSSRESLNIFIQYKHRGGLKALYELFIYIFKSKYARECFFIDNFKTPFNKYIHCPLFGHKFVNWTDEDEKDYYCKKCFEYKIVDNPKIYERKQKLKKYYSWLVCCV